jgi:hypothetical protein
MKGLDRRLRQVATVSHRRQQVTARRRYDVSDLTPREQYELAVLLDRVKPSIPQEDGSQVALTPDEQRRLEALVARMRVVEPGAQ